MEYAPFYTLFPELGKRETRSATVLKHTLLPADEYGLIEMFCTDPNCDCRRVMFSIYGRNHPEELLAVVAYGWESAQFYADWYGDDDPKIIRAMQGPELNVGSPQTSLAPALLELVREILQDETYVDRIKQHYRIFKEAINAQSGQKQRRKIRGRTRPLRKRKKWL
jgi:hypothetical protein